MHNHYFLGEKCDRFNYSNELLKVQKDHNENIEILTKQIELYKESIDILNEEMNKSNMQKNKIQLFKRFKLKKINQKKN